MSPGLVALGPGMFSVRGVTTTRLTLVMGSEEIDVVEGSQRHTGAEVERLPKLS